MPTFFSAYEAVQTIEDGDTLVIGASGGGLLEANSLLEALEQRFCTTGSPRDLTLIFPACAGDRAESGLGHLAHEGLIKRAIGGHWGMAPNMGKLAAEEKIEAYNLPQGVISQLFREIAAGRPGLITHVGIGTFIDPRIEGGKLNRSAREDIVHLIDILGEKKLLYPCFKPDVAFIKGSLADEKGNISLEKEPSTLEVLAIAQAVCNKGGNVIVQVQRVVANGSLDPRMVKIPGYLVDIIVEDPDQWQTLEQRYNPALSGEHRLPAHNLKPLPLNERKVIARRAAMEVKPGNLVNLGVGIPDGVAAVAAEEGFFDQITFSIEQGAYGGVPAGGLIFGVTYNPDAIIDAPYQFDFIDGGGIDVACLGMAQVDQFGNVNVSKIGNQIIGTGGFVNISQNSKMVIFCGTFTGGGLQVEIDEGKLRIKREGSYKKIVERVDQITFSSEFSETRGQKVLYVTERAVFVLTKNGLELMEVAPGISLEKDIFPLIPFKVRLHHDLKIMNKSIFLDRGMQLINKFNYIND